MPRSARVLSAAQVKEPARKEGECSVGGVPGLCLMVRKFVAGDPTASRVLRELGVNSFRKPQGKPEPRRQAKPQSKPQHQSPVQ